MCISRMLQRIHAHNSANNVAASSARFDSQRVISAAVSVILTRAQSRATGMAMHVILPACLQVPTAHA